MPISSLAEQLARGASLNANLLNEKSRSQAASESYLFSPKEARQHDLDSLHALGLNGFLQLKSLQPDLAHFEQALFSDSSRHLDRTLQPAEQNASLDSTISAFLPTLGPFLLDAPTGKVLEWLVRRFRIHEFNVSSVVSLFLPYHETPHFLKMVSILHIPDNSPLRFLQAYKKAAKPLHRPLLINDILSKPEAARLASSILPVTLKHHPTAMHRALIAFHAGVLLEYIAKVKVVDENITAFLLPAAMEPLESASAPESSVRPALLQETILGSYLLLAAISQKTHLTRKAVKSFLASVADCAERVSPKQLVRTLVSICAPQDQLEKLPSSAVNTLLDISQIELELVGAMPWVGSEKFLVPLVESLLAKPTATVYPILESIVVSQQLPTSVAQPVASNLVRRLTEEASEDQGALELRKLLSQLHQRRPKAVQDACQTAIREDEQRRDAVEGLVTSLAVSAAGASSDDVEITTSLVGSAAADAIVRAKCVRDLVSRLADDRVAESDAESIATTLLLRVADSSPSVLQALYTTSPDATAKALLSLPHPTAYLDELKSALHGANAKPSRDVIRAHLTFLLSHYLPIASTAASESADESEEPEESEENRERSRLVFMDVLLPFLLYSKPRAKTAQTVWDLIETAEDGATFELLGGCAEAARWERARTSSSKKDSTEAELMPKINIAVAAKIADNILASNYFQAHLTMLLEKLHDENAHGRALAYLVTRALLNRLGGDQRIEAGHRVLQAMNLDSLEELGDSLREAQDVAAFLSDTSVGSAVVHKPNSQGTLRRLQISVLSVLPSFPRPANTALEWVGDSSQAKDIPTVDNRAARYVQLLRAVYTVSNSAVSLPLLSTHLLRLLFINLADDGLTFLVGLWLSPYTPVHIQYAALRHACAFMEAYVATGRTVDLQTVLPALIIGLQSTDPGTRDAAARCVSVIAKLSFSPDAESIYAFDAIYGAQGSSWLQYLDWADVQKYARALAEARDSLVHDPEYVQAFHREHLASIKGEPKKVAGYKQRVLCFLLSHVNGCHLVNVKVRLLEAIQGVSSSAKAQTLGPTIQSVLNDEFAAWDGHQQLAALVASTFDESVAMDLNDPDKNAWAVYEKLLTTSIKQAQWQPSRDALLHRLEHGLFAKLNIDRKTQLCHVLLSMSTEEDSLAIACKKVLANVLSDNALIARLLVSLQPQPSADLPAQPTNKRPRVDKVLSASSEELSSLGILAEIVGSLTVLGSLELISSLLETLNKVFSNISPDVADRRYVEQLLMSAIENVSQYLPPSTTAATGSIRVDTLVEILRTSDNPQTFHQACLLMASLARIAPDAVLHNVMPIFTFMGSNVFHRDDAYSFRVVQKTIDSIVPVMVSSLKDAHSSGLGLYCASRDFLRVFTGAANHVPRHRRVNFFTHLVDTLGPSDFLAPVIMLLVDRVSSRVVRQHGAESTGSLFLPLAVFERYPVELQLSAFVEIVLEAERLAQCDSSASPFLDSSPGDDQAQVDIIARRRATALLVCCEQSLKRLRPDALSHSQTESNSAQDLLRHLIAISSSRTNDASYAEITAAARSALISTLGIMSAPNFVAGIMVILGSTSTHAQSIALDLLAERLNDIADKMRHAITPTIIKIIEGMRHILSTASEVEQTGPALRAFEAVSKTLSPGEESAVAAAVPLVLNLLAQKTSRLSAMQTLLAFSSKLGPRAIPHLKEIVKACTQCSRESIHNGSYGPALTSAVLQVLRNLMTSIPTFWGEQEVLQVVQLHLDSAQVTGTHTADMSLLIRTTAKRISPSVLLPALCRICPSVVTLGSPSSVILAYVQVVKVAVKAASRQAVLEHLRELSKSFLAMFDFCAASMNSKHESALTSSFIEVVVKLNENAFRPIFRKFFDWAFANGPSSTDTRKAVFCHVYTAMLDFFKGLMVPYMTFAWPTVLEQMRTYAAGAPDNGELWLAVLQIVTKSMSADEDRVFWRNDKLRQFIPLAIQQVPLAPEVDVPEAKNAVSDCLSALLAVVDDDVMVKTINLDILMNSRSEDARVRLFSLACAEQLWKLHGEKLLGYASETATFIAEAAEDENDLVVQQAHKLKAAVEAVGGSIDVA